MKKLCIFDFDGTLFNSLPDVIIGFRKTLKIHNLPVLTDDEFRECVGGNIDDIVSKIIKDDDIKNIESVKNTYLNIMEKSKKENTLPYPGVGRLLSELENNNILLAINSNRTTDSIKYYVDKYLEGVDFFEIMGDEPQYPSKPDPYAVRKIIEKSKVPTGDVVYIGDSATDIQTAENAGIDYIIVRWGYGNENDYLTNSVCDSEELLRKIREI